MRRMHQHRWAALLIALSSLSLLTGCGGTLPPIGGASSGPSQVRIAEPAAGATGTSGGPPAAVGATVSTPAPNAATVTRQAALGQQNASVRVAAKKSTLTLYNGATGDDGTRVPTASLPNPIRGRYSAANPDRIEIMTVYGPRWLSRSEVQILPPKS